MRRRRHAIFLRLSDAEHQKLLDLLEATGLTVSEYFRFHLLGFTHSKQKPIVKSTK